MGLTEAKLGGVGQLLSKYKLCALYPVKVTNYFCDKGSKNCWWVALRKVPGASQRWAKGWSWNGIQPLLCDNQILPSLTVTPAPSSLPLLPTLWTDILRLEGVDETRQSRGKRKEEFKSLLQSGVCSVRLWGEYLHFLQIQGSSRPIRTHHPLGFLETQAKLLSESNPARAGDEGLGWTAPPPEAAGRSISAPAAPSFPLPP